MRLLVLVFWLSLACVFTLRMFFPSEAAFAAARQYFTEDTIQTNYQLAWESNWYGWASRVLALGWLTLLACTSLGRSWTDRLHRAAGQRWWLTVLLLGGVCLLGERLVTLPVSILFQEHLRSLGLTYRSFGGWLLDYGKSLLLAEGFTLALLLGGYALLRWLPRWWWLVAGLAMGGVAVAITYLMPLVINPLFNEFTPLPAGPLRVQLLQLVKKADVPVEEIYVMDASTRGPHTNAYFTGFGDSRRIVLYDTLIKDNTEAEIVTIMAHEIGHWQHNHIVQGLVLGTLGGLFGLWLLGWILRRVQQQPPLRLTSPHDPAGVPLVLLLFAIGSWFSLPVQNAVSRHFERQADMVSLELARDPVAFKSAEKRMAITNKSNVAPHPFLVWIYNSHPPVVERIQMAEQWEREHRLP